MPAYEPTDEKLRRNYKKAIGVRNPCQSLKESRLNTYLLYVVRSGGRTHKGSNQVPGPSAKHRQPMDME